MTYKPKTHVTIELLKWGGFFEPVKRCRIKPSRRFHRRVVASLCAVTMLATTLASAMATTTYAEVIKRNAVASTNIASSTIAGDITTGTTNADTTIGTNVSSDTLAQNYLNKSISDTANGSSMSSTILDSATRVSASAQFSNKYSWITDRAILPVLYSNWRATDVDSWYFYDSDGSVRTGWIYDNGWYYLSTEDEGTAGLMKYGWYKIIRGHGIS